MSRLAEGAKNAIGFALLAVFVLAKVPAFINGKIEMGPFLAILMGVAAVFLIWELIKRARTT